MCPHSGVVETIRCSGDAATVYISCHSHFVPRCLPLAQNSTSTYSKCELAAYNSKSATCSCVISSRADDYNPAVVELAVVEASRHEVSFVDVPGKSTLHISYQYLCVCLPYVQNLMSSLFDARLETN